MRKQGQRQAKQVNRKGKYFHSCGQSRVAGTKSVDLTVTSETIRPSYITKPLHFSQGRRGNRMNKLRGPSEDARPLLFLSSESALLRMKWFFPRVIEGQVGVTYLSARVWQKKAFIRAKTQPSPKLHFWNDARELKINRVDKNYASSLNLQKKTKCIHNKTLCTQSR